MAVLNYLFFLYKKIAPKAPKAPKTQPSKSTKRYKRTKIKNALKKYQGKKRYLFAYLRFCDFCAREEKRIEKRK